MTEWIFENMSIVWIILCIVLCIIEAVTVGIASIWFAFGAVVAAIASTFTDSIMLQIIVFIAVSIFSLVLTRPLALKYLASKQADGNREILIGRNGIVVEPIRKSQTGRVRIDGVTWTAEAENPEMEIDAETVVSVLGVKGIQLIVKPI